MEETVGADPASSLAIFAAPASRLWDRRAALHSRWPQGSQATEMPGGIVSGKWAL